MKKVTAICLHENYAKVKNFSVVKSNGEIITLVHNDISTAKKYTNFKDLYCDLLSILKENNFYVAKWNDFSTTWYNINFIDIKEPNQPKRFACSLL